jgi:hypothetical protein
MDMKGRRGRPRRFTTGTTTKPFLMATRIEMPANHGQSMIRKSMPSGHDPMGGHRFSLARNAKRLRGDHTQTKRSSAMTIRRKVIPL